MHNFKKLALSFSDLTPGQQRAAFAAAVGLTGGVVGGGLNYVFTKPRHIQDLYPEAHPSEFQRLRKRRAILTGLGLGVGLGTETYLNTPDTFGQRAASGPSPVDWRADFKPVFDPQRHGEKFKKVYDTVVSSAELNDPLKRQAFSNFMKSVGTPGADVESLRAHMAHFPTDSTVAGPFMNILMGRHHPKTASYRAPSSVRLKAASLIALYRAISGRR